ncbi:MAG: hypothetical protein EOP84_34510, partial [Verrucomicrobiaceae bacterium]
MPIESGCGRSPSDCVKIDIWGAGPEVRRSGGAQRREKEWAVGNREEDFGLLREGVQDRPDVFSEIVDIQILGSRPSPGNGRYGNAVWVGRFLGEQALTATANANNVMFLLLGAVFG